MNRLLTIFLAFIWCLPLRAAQTDCAKLATLGKRGLASLPSRQIESQPYQPVEVSD